MNYQLKETAITVFKSGIDKDKTKIKFFCNYLYQLSARLKKNYEVFLVRNIGKISDLKIERIQGLFDYKGKSFTDNELFTVVNDNFILKFKKT